MPWFGIDVTGTLQKHEEKRWQTPVLDAGDYEFTMSGDGDADLYVKIGRAPTTSTYDCKPYKSGANETCEMRLAQPAAVHLMARGVSDSSAFHLVGRRAVARK